MTVAAEQQKILVVDDDNVFRQSLIDALDARGFSVFGAGGGMEGMALVEKHRVALVISDVLMPDMDGIEFLAKLNELPSRPKTIIMSGGGRIQPTNYLRMASLQGASGVLAKPFGIDKLIEIVGKLLNEDSA